MREKMKKMLFLMLFLLILGAANVISQVRIGGNGQPNTAAVLDLNATDAINNGTKTLALPRVSLASTTDKLGSTTLLNGMLVYNTNTASGAGVYYWDTNQWVKVSGGEFVGNEITDTIAGGGLTRSGLGTEASPYKVGIKPNGIVNSMIADGAVSLSKISTTATDSGYFIASDGKRVTVTRPYSTQYYDTVTVRADKNVLVSWRLVADTTVRIQWGLGTTNRITAPGIRTGDFCISSDRAHHSVFWTHNDLITSASLLGTPATYMTKLRCYRPQF
ncbi:hypothetical protein FACS189451_11600 [Bacteroidia bacterium]|nr:hypothetical protein FACS189451_11600 [Bacteroidia bacterium]